MRLCMNGCRALPCMPASSQEPRDHGIISIWMPLGSSKTRELGGNRTRHELVLPEAGVDKGVYKRGRQVLPGRVDRRAGGRPPLH